MLKEDTDINIVKKISNQENHSIQGRKCYEVKLERYARTRL